MLHACCLPTNFRGMTNHAQSAQGLANRCRYPADGSGSRANLANANEPGQDFEDDSSLQFPHDISANRCSPAAMTIGSAQFFSVTQTSYCLRCSSAGFAYEIRQLFLRLFISQVQ